MHFWGKLHYPPMDITLGTQQYGLGSLLGARMGSTWKDGVAGPKDLKELGRMKANFPHSAVTSSPRGRGGGNGTVQGPAKVEITKLRCCQKKEGRPRCEAFFKDTAPKRMKRIQNNGYLTNRKRCVVMPGPTQSVSPRPRGQRGLGLTLTRAD